jgi:hypothetical protein
MNDEVRKVVTLNEKKFNIYYLVWRLYIYACLLYALICMNVINSKSMRIIVILL